MAPTFNEMERQLASPLADDANTSDPYSSFISQSATEFDLDPNLIRSVMSAESSGRPEAVSPKGAAGLMQLMPDTAKGLGVTDIYDPAQNIRGGSQYLSQMLRKYDGDVNKALAAYNWGPGNADKWLAAGADPAGLPSETSKYIQRVTSGLAPARAPAPVPSEGMTFAAMEATFAPDDALGEVEAPATPEAEEKTPLFSLTETDPTKLGRFQSAISNVTQGFADVMAGIPKGASIAYGALTGEDPRDMAAYKFGEDLSAFVKEKTPVSPKYQEEFIPKVAGGVGSMLGFIPAAALGGPTALAQIAGAGIVGAGLSASEQFEDALNNGASLADAMTSAGYGSILGTTEGVPITRMLDRLDKGTGGGIRKLLTQTIKGGTEELIQEVSQIIGGNLIASDLVKYDPERQMFEGVIEGGEVAFTVGGLFNFLAGLAGGRRARAPAPEQQDPATSPRTRAAAEQEVKRAAEYQPGPVGMGAAAEGPEFTQIPVQEVGGAVGTAAATPPPVEKVSPPAPPVAPVPEEEVAVEPGVTSEEVEVAAVEADPEPTEAQIEAGNYKKGHVKVHGLDISIENAKGSERSGKDADGKPWSVTMPAHYGYVKRTEGADGDQVDVYLGEDMDAPQVHIVDQVDADTKEFDEHKVMVGFASEAEARQTYEAGFSDGRGPDRIGAITSQSVDEFKTWLSEGDTTAPVTYEKAEAVIPTTEEKPTPDLAKGWESYIETAKKIVRKKDGGIVKPGLIMRTTDATPEQAQRVIDHLRSKGQLTPKGYAWKKATKPRDAIDIIRELGGIRPSGETRAMDLQKARPGLVRDSAPALNELRTAFEELGILPEGSTDDQVHGLIATALAKEPGRPFHPADDDLVEAVRVEEEEQAKIVRIDELKGDIRDFARQIRLQLTTAEIDDMAARAVDDGMEATDVVDEHIEGMAITALEQGQKEVQNGDYDDIPFDIPEKAAPKPREDVAVARQVEPRPAGEPEDAEAGRERAERDEEQRRVEGEEPSVEADLRDKEISEAIEAEERAAPRDEERDRMEVKARAADTRMRAAKEQVAEDELGGLFGVAETPLEKAAREAEAPKPTPEPAKPIGTGPYTLDVHHEIAGRVQAGNITAEEIRTVLPRISEAEDALKAELNKFKKDKLIRLSGVMRRDFKKDQLVSLAYDELFMDLVASRGFSYSPFSETREEAVRRTLEKQTDEDVAKYAEEIKKSRAEFDERRTALKKSLTDPETLEDFKIFIRSKGEDALSPEQLAAYDELRAEENRERAKTTKETKATVEAVDIGDITMEIVETVHSTKGHDLFVVTLSDRVERDVYKDLVSKARRLGGYYSSYKKGDAVPGYQFKTREAAEQFVALKEGDVSRADDIEERTAQVKGNAVDRLRSMADTFDAKATESLETDRRTNTSRQAGMAASAEEKARNEQAMAVTMRNLADAIENGEAKNLEGLRNKAQIEALDLALSRARSKWAIAETKKDDRKKYDDLRHTPFSEEMISHVEFPYPGAHAEILKDIAEAVMNVDGGKLIGKKFQKVAYQAIKDAQSGKGGYWVSIVNPRWRDNLDKLLSVAKRAGVSEYKYGQIEDQTKDFRRFVNMGIPDLPTMRAALREYLQHKGKKTKADPIKKMERELIGNKSIGKDFFPTPPAVIERIMDEADIQEGMRVLEPSAGKGDIADAAKVAGGEVDTIEISFTLREILEAKGHHVIEHDFESFVGEEGKYDRVVMNPPFSDRLDAQHVRKAYDMLKPGGRLVAITGEGVFFGSDKKATAFRDWLDEVDGTSEKLPEGSFKSAFRSTGVATRLVVIDKPEAGAPEKFQRRLDEGLGLFSALSDAARAIPQAKGRAAQMLAMIRKQPGVREEEIEFTGLDAFLGDPRKPVTRDEIVEFLDGNGVQIEEVVKGEARLEITEVGRAEAGDFGNFEVFFSDGSSVYVTAENEDEARAKAHEEAEQLDEPAVETKFAKYTLPGGENYREVLLTLPSYGLYGSAAYDAFNEESARLHKKYGDGFRRKATASELDKLNDLEERGEVKAPDFKGGHYDEPNVLAHFRVNDRTGPNGEKVLFIEEIQSDWHQAGRKKGYAPENVENKIEALKTRRNNVMSQVEGTRVQSDWTPEYTASQNELRDNLFEEYDNLAKEIEDLRTARGGVPDAPFKKTWHELALKRVMRMAVEQGYDSIAWTPGEVQTERYDLSKKLKEVSASKNADGTYQLAAEDKHGFDVFGAAGKKVSADEMADNIGKEIAEKLINGADANYGKPWPKNVKYNPEFFRMFPEDLKVGGEGMKSFYDKMLVNAANKITKKLRTKVEVSDIGRGKPRSLDQIAQDEGFDGWGDVAGDPRVVDLISKIQKEERAAGKRTQQVWSLPITDKMRDVVGTKGLPLFQLPSILSKLAADIKPLTENLRTQLTGLGLSGKIAMNLRDKIVSVVDGKVQAAEGRYYYKTIEVALSARDPEHTLNHEAVHALHDMGLFSTREWGALQSGARADAKRMAKIKKVYPDLSATEQTEEAIAEWYADWARGDAEVTGLVARAFEKIRAFFEALANALRARGFTTAADVFGAIERGEVGAREGVEGEVGEKFQRAPTLAKMKTMAAKAEKDGTRVMGSTTQEAAIARIMATTDVPVAQKMRDTVAELKDRKSLAMRQAMIDSFASIEVLEREENNGKLLDASLSATKASHMTQNLQSVMASVMRTGPLEVYETEEGGKWFRSKKDWDVGGFTDIFKDLSNRGLLQLWKGWAAANRAQRLAGEGRENLMSDAEIEDLLALEKQYPEFRTVLNKWAKFNKAMLDMAEAAGLMNAEQRALWENDDYVPFFRIFEEDVVGATRGKGGLTGQRSGIRRLEGGEAQLNDIIENMVMNLTSIVDRSFKNLAAQKIKDLAIDSGVMHKVPMNWSPIKVSPEEAATQLENIGVQVTGMTAEQHAEVLKMWQMKAPTEPDVVSVMVDGKPQYYRVDDPLLLNSITSLSQSQLGGILKLFRMSKRALTIGVTSDPGFMGVNIIRDSLSTWILTGMNGLLPGLKTPAGFVKAIRGDPSLTGIMAAGGGSGGFYSTDPEDVRKTVEAEISGINKKTILDTPKKMWELWNRIGSASESANRIAIYDTIIERGGNQTEAAYQALDIMDFSRRGGSVAMRTLIEMVPFMNARIQGLDRLYRGAKENPKGFMLRGSIIMAASLALLAENWDDERYEALEEWDKDTYYHFWIDDEHFRLPKPFEVGAIFSTIPERMFRYLMGRDEDKVAAGRALAMIRDTFAMNPTPQLLMPIAEEVANKSFFTGRPIIGMGLDRLPAEMQAKPSTGPTVTQLAKLMPDTLPDAMRSPARIEHMIKGYFGTLGTYALAASDSMARGLLDLPAKPANRWDDVPVVKRFYREDPARSTKYMTEFYDIKREVEKAVAGIREARRRGWVEDARKMMKKSRDKIAIRKIVQKAGKAMSDLSREMRLIHTLPTMGAQEKRRRIDKLTRDRNRIAEQIVAKVIPRTQALVKKIDAKRNAAQRVRDASNE